MLRVQLNLNKQVWNQTIQLSNQLIPQQQYAFHCKHTHILPRCRRPRCTPSCRTPSLQRQRPIASNTKWQKGKKEGKKPLVSHKRAKSILLRERMDQDTDMGSARGSRTSWCSSCRTAASSRRRTSRPVRPGLPPAANPPASRTAGLVGEASGSETAAAAQGAGCGSGRGGRRRARGRKWRWRGSDGGGARFGSWSVRSKLGRRC